MSIPLFKDFNKPANDFFSRSFPTSNKLVVKTKAQNGVSFEISAEQKKGIIASKLKPKYEVKEYDTTFEGEFLSENLFKGDLTVKDVLPGLKTKLHGETGSAQEDGKEVNRDKINVELVYANDFGNIRGDFEYNLAKEKIAVDISGVAAKDSFSAGVASKLSFAASTVQSVDVAAGYKKDDYNITLIGTSDLSDMAAPKFSTKGNVIFNADSNLKLYGEVKYDLSKALDGIDATFGGEYKFDGSSSVKSKFTQKGVLSLAYSNQLNSHAKLELGTAINTLESTGTFGLNLTVS
jgi:hypothetical protein